MKNIGDETRPLKATFLHLSSDHDKTFGRSIRLYKYSWVVKCKLSNIILGDWDLILIAEILLYDIF